MDQAMPTNLSNALYVLSGVLPSFGQVSLIYRIDQDKIHSIMWFRCRKIFIRQQYLMLIKPKIHNQVQSRDGNEGFHLTKVGASGNGVESIYSECKK